MSRDNFRICSQVMWMYNCEKKSHVWQTQYWVEEKKYLLMFIPTWEPMYADRVAYSESNSIRKFNTAEEAVEFLCGVQLARQKGDEWEQKRKIAEKSRRTISYFN